MKGNGYFRNIIHILLNAEHSVRSTCGAAHEDISDVRLGNEEHCPKKKLSRKTDGIHKGLALSQVYYYLHSMSFSGKV